MGNRSCKKVHAFGSLKMVKNGDKINGEPEITSSSSSSKGGKQNRNFEHESRSQYAHSSLKRKSGIAGKFCDLSWLTTIHFFILLLLKKFGTSLIFFRTVPFESYINNTCCGFTQSKGT